MTWWKQKNELFSNEKEKYKVLIVTYTDIHRGPMLREIFNKKMTDSMKKFVTFRSAGIYADNGDNIAMYAYRSLKKFGVRLNPYEHESNTLTKTLLDEPDVFLTIDKYGYDTIKREIGDEKLIRLTDYSSDETLKETKDIQSPRDDYCLDYEKLLDIFDDCTDNYLKYLAEKFDCTNYYIKIRKPQHWWEE